MSAADGVLVGQAEMQMYLNDVAGHKARTEAAAAYYESKYSRPGDDIAQQTEAYLADALQQIALDIERLSTRMAQVVDVQASTMDGLTTSVDAAAARLLRARHCTATDKLSALRTVLPQQPVYKAVVALGSEDRGRVLQPYRRSSVAQRLDSMYTAPQHSDAGGYNDALSSSVSGRRGAHSSFSSAAPAAVLQPQRPAHASISDMPGSLSSPVSSPSAAAQSAAASAAAAAARSSVAAAAAPPQQSVYSLPRQPPPAAAASLTPQQPPVLLAPPVLLSKRN
jgi:hypothetical protein